MRSWTAAAWLAIPLCLFPASARCLVVIDDTVAVKGQEVMLRAETRGRLFPKGGELVEFFVDGESIGRNLSGGDGVAFKQFVPTKTGLYHLRATYGGDEDTGLLLSLEKGAGIVFIDVEGSLMEGLFSGKPRHGSRKAVKEIDTNFPIVFLQTGFFKVNPVKAWLKENQFPQAPVVPWRRGAVFDQIVKRGLKIEAIVAGPKVIESARKHEALSFSFEEAEGAEHVTDWEEISKKLQLERKESPPKAPFPGLMVKSEESIPALQPCPGTCKETDAHTNGPRCYRLGLSSPPDYSLSSWLAMTRCWISEVPS